MVTTCEDVKGVSCSRLMLGLDVGTHLWRRRSHGPPPMVIWRRGLLKEVQRNIGAKPIAMEHGKPLGDFQ